VQRNAKNFASVVITLRNKGLFVRMTFGTAFVLSTRRYQIPPAA